MKLGVNFVREIREGEESGVIMTEEVPQSIATNVIITKGVYEGLMRCYYAHPDWEDPGKKEIKIGYSIECPDCHFVQTGFDTEEEASAWECPECQPTLPGMESP